MPERFIQLEAEFRDKDVTDEKTIRLDKVRKMTHLAYFDDVIESIAKNPKIVGACGAFAHFFKAPQDKGSLCALGSPCALGSLCAKGRIS